MGDEIRPLGTTAQPDPAYFADSPFEYAPADPAYGVELIPMGGGTEGAKPFKDPDVAQYRTEPIVPRDFGRLADESTEVTGTGIAPSGAGADYYGGDEIMRTIPFWLDVAVPKGANNHDWVDGGIERWDPIAAQTPGVVVNVAAGLPVPGPSPVGSDIPLSAPASPLERDLFTIGGMS